MEYKLANGGVITDEEIERECKEYESGAWTGSLVIKRIGYMEFSTIEEMRKYYAQDQFANKCLNAQIDDYDFETGIARVSMDLDDRHHNALGGVMGGVLFALADYALAIACNTNQPNSVSVDHSISFLKAAKGTHLIATARPERLGRRLAFFSVDIHDELDTYISHMSATVCRV